MVGGKRLHLPSRKRMMKSKISTREKILLVVLFCIEGITNLLAKFLGVGVQNYDISINPFGDMSRWIIYIVEFLGITIIFLLLKSIIRNKLNRVGLIIVLSGLLGNTVWRILFGSVWQWIDLMYIPTFNLADLMIVVGSGITLLSVVWHGIE